MKNTKFHTDTTYVSSKYSYFPWLAMTLSKQIKRKNNVMKIKDNWPLKVGHFNLNKLKCQLTG